jgi:hypothetical protein
MQDTNPHMGTDEVLTVEEFARRLKVGRSTVYGWVHAGKLVEGVSTTSAPRAGRSGFAGRTGSSTASLRRPGPRPPTIRGHRTLHDTPLQLPEGIGSI